MTKQQPKLHRDQDPGTTQPEGNSTHLNYKFFFFFFLDTQIFPVLVVNSLCKNIFLIFFSKFPVFSLSGKMDFQIPCFPCALATMLFLWNGFHIHSIIFYYPFKIFCRSCVKALNINANIYRNRQHPILVRLQTGLVHFERHAMIGTIKDSNRRSS